ncbi:hypothetical protein KAFR_0K01060 [Kazachstania africana CBS 2517]|uniref:Altered inheritance of mitochondria protein 21 n=1 Tax=Kazachstania africana (strain ATCC 22294 / BCRC 22015 / CBS 2517 / CECT 1963 / NBRC 1671 / NRRL Y-8276) TaxID=1071382 RepID=H2B1G2_KAZAF|nr:hypothetical protein KAFR_0K01060 [Kazachstania africana CBS 2517]CCF60462.1 hypothetical protein KAFR_0K01060 [Kazachstania africana CBS 2517]
MPSRRPIVKAKTTGSFENSNSQEPPKIPSQRPVRRTTTEIIEDNESDEDIIESYGTEDSKPSDVDDVPSIPRRPQRQGLLQESNDINKEEQSIAYINSIDSESSNKNEDTTSLKDVIPEQPAMPERPAKRETSEIFQHGSNMEKSEKKHTLSTTDVADEVQESPIIPERPMRKKSRETLSESGSSLNSPEHSDAIEAPQNVPEEDLTAPDSDVMTSEENYAVQKNESTSSNNSEEVERKRNDLQDESSPPLGETSVSMDPRDEEESRLIKNLEREGGQHTVKDQGNGILTEDQKVASLADLAAQQSTSLLSENQEQTALADLAAQKEIMGMALNDKLTIEPVETTISAKLSEPDISSPVELKDEKETSSSSSKEKKEESQTPTIPERPKKRAPPPVPKKPSSRIAAFHKLLERQQLQELNASKTSGGTEGEEKEDKSENVSEAVKTGKENSINSQRTEFARNLNGLFALPGMVPMDGALPKALGKNLSPPSENITSEEPVVTETSRNEVSDVRQRRARGPRGRKLPSSVSNVKKVVAENSTSSIEVFEVWTISNVRKAVAEQTREEATSAHSPFESEISEGYVVEEDGKEINTAQSEETKVTMVNGSPSETSSTEELEKTMSSDEENITEGVNHEEPSVTSISESVECRDENNQVEEAELEYETRAEKQMEEEILKDDQVLSDVE